MRGNKTSRPHHKRCLSSILLRGTDYDLTPLYAACHRPKLVEILGRIQARLVDIRRDEEDTERFQHGITDRMKNINMKVISGNTDISDEEASSLEGLTEKREFLNIVDFQGRIIITY